MNKDKRKKLAAKGWKVGSAEEFLNLTPDESAYINLKIKLAQGLSLHRKKQRLTQIQLAQRIKSSQSRVAKMEAGDPSVSLDLLIKSLLALGSSPAELARLIGGRKSSLV
jgi:DNA-binding XRE family transcriptional regulator